MSKASEFQTWAKDFSMSDDGVEAFEALCAVDAIRFELAIRDEGFIDRIEAILDGR